MSITITLTADNVEDLARQFYLLTNMGDTVEKVMTLKEHYDAKQEALADIGNKRTLEESKAKAKKAPAKAVAKAVVKAPEPPEEDDEDVDPDTIGGDEDTIELQTMKDEQLDRLRELFSAGKVKFVRELLSTYGNGAKVFPEVDATAFPAIKKAIDKELGA